MQAVGEAHDTPDRKPAVAPDGPGVRWTDHEDPFHSSASMTSAPDLFR
jgi:hypothetical protein